MSETSPAVRAVWRSARQIRRYYENGGTKATVESNILPLIYELAPSIDFTEDESERLKGYPLEWTGRKSFKAALNRFRKEATKAGYPVPEASKNWILFNSEVPIPPARETRSGTAITIWSTSDTSAPSKSEGTPAPPASTSPSSTSSTSPPSPASTSSTSPPPPASTSPPSTSSPLRLLFGLLSRIPPHSEAVTCQKIFGPCSIHWCQTSPLHLVGEHFNKNARCMVAILPM
ncbi:hypothetical protein BKA56DRAFT_624664 [Ilyonectria sp. MPI-CAGE-AT-0026]|nr:hypothetical protein BKA56DRAFT_624664 [Ilyonectria sp. MPI-CAGE-AT-0026]